MKTLVTDAEEYLAALRSERGLATNTVAAYRRDLGQYFDFLDDPAAGSDASAQGFVGFLTESGLAPSTIARKLAAVRGYHRFLVLEGHTHGITVATDFPVFLVKPVEVNHLQDEPLFK